MTMTVGGIYPEQQQLRNSQFPGAYSSYGYPGTELPIGADEFSPSEGSPARNSKRSAFYFPGMEILILGGLAIGTYLGGKKIWRSGTVKSYIKEPLTRFWNRYFTKAGREAAKKASEKIDDVVSNTANLVKKPGESPFEFMKRVTKQGNTTLTPKAPDSTVWYGGF